jgi:serine/threonine protein kinase
LDSKKKRYEERREPVEKEVTLLVMSSLLGWWSGLLSRLLSMGCVLLRPALTVQGVRYKVLRQLAEGGFSTVHLARNAESGRKVALKRITCHSIEDQNVARLEAETMKRFSHENIIQLVSWAMVGEADLVHGRTSEVILVLPFYPRGTLQQELEGRAAANGTGKKKFRISKFLITKFLIIKFLIAKFLSNKVPK